MSDDKTKEELNSAKINNIWGGIKGENINIMPNLIMAQKPKPTNSDEFNIWLNTLSEQRFGRFMKHMKSIGESKSV